MRIFRFLLLPLCVLVFVAGAKKPKATVRFHVEVDPVSGSAFSTTSQLPDNREVTLGKVPEISEQDIVAIHPFEDALGTWGCAFKLNPGAKNRLEALSVERKGSMMVAFVQGRMVTAMIIDRRVSDGVIIIPSGIDTEEMELLLKAFQPKKKGKRGK